MSTIDHKKTEVEGWIAFRRISLVWLLWRSKEERDEYNDHGFPPDRSAAQVVLHLLEPFEGKRVRIIIEEAEDDDGTP